MISQQRINQWLDKRIPAANAFQLDHRNIFIFPAKFGLLYLMLCLLLFLLGTNYQNNLMLLLCYFLLALFLVNLLSAYVNFARLSVSMGKIPEVYASDDVYLPLWINADKSLKTPMHGIVNIGFMGQKVNQWFDCDAFSNPVSLSYPCQHRGWQQAERITFSCYYPLGLFKCWTHLAFNRKILVFPKPLACPLELVPAPLSSEETPRASNNLSLNTNQDDFSHLKAYQIGEPLRHVAWKQVAKGRGMLSKEFNGSSHNVAWLTLNNSTAEHIEKTLSKLCFQVLELSRADQQFGLDLAYIRIAPASGENHRLACLTALAQYPTIADKAGFN
ncbi:hypothetical protein AX660_11250 [Paraglaciecola hydrolytica]|uniref:Uncharacterized protein n=1 Tax=Paraglaciecola hydrolytica TaxID=1799789 RepID=A0A136A2I4_9ALTE|nr:hypothetical protein AX660_11250 [Paraglaciecola hydrolytica]